MSGGVRYTRERLAEAAERCASLDEVVAYFGTRPYGKVCRYLARRFAHFGIDISHFARSGGHARPGPDELCRAVTESASVAETLRRLGRPDNGTQRALRRTWIAEDRLSTEHFLGQAHQRGRRRPDRVRRPEGTLVQHEGRRRTRTCLRPMTLGVDHINGDWSDDRRGNLRLLCPNCHATTTTWCRGGPRRRTLAQ